MPSVGEQHGDAVLVGSGDDLLVPHRAARLHDRAHPGRRGGVGTVAEREERIAREDAALVAWEKLQEAVRRAGRYQSVLFDDAKISRVVEAIGGWGHVCDWPAKEMSIHRAQFLKAYQALDVPAENRPLIGSHDGQNAANGYLDYVGAPVQIGAKPKLLELR